MIVGMSYDESHGSVKRGYDLAVEALYHLADKLTSIRDDNDQITSELMKRRLDVSVGDLIAKAKRLREIYQRPDTPAPVPGSKDKDNYALKMEEEQSFVNSIRGLICFALEVYAIDLIQMRQDIPRQVIIRKPNPEQVQALLKMNDIEKQLEFVEDAMEQDWCGKY